MLLTLYCRVMLKLFDALQDVQKGVTDVKGILMNEEPYASHAKKFNDLLDETGRCGNGLGVSFYIVTLFII